jgi:hypothetical protein
MIRRLKRGKPSEEEEDRKGGRRGGGRKTKIREMEGKR